jgi:NADP-dependent 3-hydroxy acid dehydrogenase YdfG
MKKRFQDKVVIITGASSGIGKATALAFTAEGAITVLASRNEGKLKLVADEIERAGGKTSVVPTDVSDPLQINSMVDQVMASYGRVDVLFNNAGKSFVGPIDGSDFVENAKEMFGLDYLGVVYGVRAVLPIMKKQGFGHILNMSSVVGKKAFPEFGAYSSMMHAISGFTDSLRQELAGTPVSVSIVHPALTQTALLERVDPARMPPPFRYFTPISPEQVAQKIVDGVYRKKEKLIVPGQPKVLLFLDALSTRLGDWFVRQFSKKWFARLLGLYRGKAYHDISSDRQKNSVVG